MMKSGFVILLVLLVHLIAGSPIQKENSKDMCRLPKLTGECRAHMQRWRYDPATGTCDQFTYGGCRGNENNFITEEACMATCSGV
ncbi:kunitz-type serine protease inhibitor 4 [Leptinotarsa decemlineata]|uniref:kunitz-type serine protease inhibitor 4 n=1 Tax=Leptinotarsa decemlineata TaxID=7539 RepID=UPI003D309295